MGKEDGKRHDQGLLAQTIQDLEKRNHDEFGNRLFSKFKANGKETLVFPTPLSRKIGDKDVDEFLVISIDESKAIQVDNRYTTFANTETIGNLIMGRLGREPGFFSPAGYQRDSAGETLRIGGKFVITPKRAELFFSAAFGNSANVDDNGCRLVEIDDDRIKKILQVNIDRVNKVRTTSKKVTSVLSGGK